MSCKVTHCAGRVLANTRPHQLKIANMHCTCCVEIAILLMFLSLHVTSVLFQYSSIICPEYGLLFTCSYSSHLFLCTLGNIHDISKPDSFMYTMLQVMYMTFQYLTVSCIPAMGHVYDISIPDSFMYTCYGSCI